MEETMEGTILETTSNNPPKKRSTANLGVIGIILAPNKAHSNRSLGKRKRSLPVMRGMICS